MPETSEPDNSATLARIPAFRPTDGIGAALATLDPPWIILRQGGFSPWIILRQGGFSLFDGERGEIYGGIYIALHPAKGVALVDLAPADPETALPQLRKLLHAARREEDPMAQVPLVAVSLTREDLAAAEDRLSEAFARATPCAIEDGSWIEIASKALASRFPELMHVQRAEFEAPVPESEVTASLLIRVDPEEPASGGMLEVFNPSHDVRRRESRSTAALALLGRSLRAGRGSLGRVQRATTAITSASFARLKRSMHAARVVAGRAFRSRAAANLATAGRALPKRMMKTVQTLLANAHRSVAALVFTSFAQLKRTMHAACALPGRAYRSKVAANLVSVARALPKRTAKALQTRLASAHRSVAALAFASYARLKQSLHGACAPLGRAYHSKMARDLLDGAGGTRVAPRDFAQRRAVALHFLPAQ